MTTKPWQLIWQDDFDGSEIDSSKWHIDQGYTGASNKELQIYTNRKENICILDCCLVLTAVQEKYLGHNFTSARVSTKGLHAWTYGRFEAYIKIPTGKGVWPAFWMLGQNINTVSWPNCGEIDIMENIGSIPGTIRGTLHGPGYAKDDSVGADFSLPGHDFSKGFHLYAIEWEPNEIRWFVDDHLFSTLTHKDVPGNWVFDHPFFILINLAIGGFYPGYPDESTQFPQTMLIDYVRVYTLGF